MLRNPAERIDACQRQTIRVCDYQCLLSNLVIYLGLKRLIFPSFFTTKWGKTSAKRQGELRRRLQILILDIVW
jgi:hypothetical protein